MEGKFRKGFVVLRWYVLCSFYLMHGWRLFEIHISSFSGIAHHHHQQQQPLQKWNYAAPWCVMSEEKTPECYFFCSARRHIKWIIKLLYPFERGLISYFMFINIICKTRWMSVRSNIRESWNIFLALSYEYLGVLGNSFLMYVSHRSFGLFKGYMHERICTFIWLQ